MELRNKLTAAAGISPRVESPRMIAVFCLAVIAGCVFAYLPGLDGPFLFDDFGTLSELGSLGGVRDWSTFTAFVLGGEAGPTGRPIALLTFLIDGTNWPTDAWPFKRTNLILHICTAIVLAVLIYSMLVAVSLEAGKARVIAACAASAWMLHPFLVSTTLYAVQRMAQLSTFFVLSGLLLFVRGRLLLAHNSLRGHVLMSTGIAVFGLLALLSKENGALLPILVAVFEFTLFANHRARGDTPNRYWLLAFIVLPSIGLVLYLLSFAAGGRWSRPNPMRGISVYERLLTEGRILADYLNHWFIPKIYTNGVFQDHYEPSNSLFDPLATAFSWLAHVFAITMAIIWRRRLPVAACAILFFYAAHLMESTVVNLELYFEHRNYLAVTLLFVPLFLWVGAYAPKWGFATAAIVIPAVLMSFTLRAATSWSSYPTMLQAASIAAPTSARAQQQYSQLLFNSGDYSSANLVIDRAIARLPKNESLWLYKTIISCHQKNDSPELIDGLTAAVEEKAFDVRLFDYYQNLVSVAANGQCQALTLGELRTVLQRMQEVEINRNPVFPGYRQLHYLIGIVDVQLGDTPSASRHFRQALSAEPTIDRAMMTAAIFASNARYYEARVFSDIALSMFKSGSSSRTVRESDVREFQRNVKREIVGR